MQHVLRISRRIDYGLRAMIFLASVVDGRAVSFRKIAQRMQVPEDFLAKILKTLVDRALVRSSRGPNGGYALGRPAEEISFLEVIEAVEGPIALNVCLDDEGCGREDSCTMVQVWREGQRRMLDVYRASRLSDLRLPNGGAEVVRIGRPPGAETRLR